MCKHDITKSNIDLFATNVCPLHLVKVRYILSAVSLAARYELSGPLGGRTVHTAVLVVQVARSMYNTVTASYI